MPSNAQRLPITWLQTDDPQLDPWVLTGDQPDDPGWRDACIGNGLIGQRVTADGDGAAYHLRSASFRHGLWGAATENPARPEGLIELPRWATLSVDDDEGDLRRNVMRRSAYRQSLDLRTATVTTEQTLQGSLRPIEVRRRTWLCRQMPQVGVLEVEVTAPQGGRVGVEESLDVMAWPDLADCRTELVAPSVASEGEQADLLLEAVSGHAGRRVIVQSRVLIDADAPVDRHRATTQPTWAHRRWRWLLKRGQTVRVYKLAAITTDLDDADPQAFGRSLLDQASRDIDQLRADHEAAWRAMWETGVEAPHRKLQLLCNVSLYHHLIAMRGDGDNSHGPCGLAGNGWDSLVFWDTEAWTLPNYALLYPELARSCVRYRSKTLAGARANAKACGETGARWAWMSGSDGRECCSMSVYQNERHIVSCVALGQWLYAQCSGDDAWLAGPGREVMLASASYWAGKVQRNDDGSYSINGVCGPDEHAGVVDDNATTNVGAAWTLRVGASLLAESDATTASQWREIADRLRLPWDEQRQIPKQMAGWRHGQTIKQADATLMIYPWQHPFDEATKARLVDYYRAHYPDKPIMMGLAIDGVIDCELGRAEQAWEALGRLCEHLTLPFLTASESPVNERLPFLTGYGGLLQMVLAGFAGIRVRGDGMTIRPALPTAIDWLRIRGLWYRGQRFNAVVHADGRIELDGAEALAING